MLMPLTGSMINSVVISASAGSSCLLSACAAVVVLGVVGITMFRPAVIRWLGRQIDLGHLALPEAPNQRS